MANFKQILEVSLDFFYINNIEFIEISKLP